MKNAETKKITSAKEVTKSKKSVADTKAKSNKVAVKDTKSNSKTNKKATSTTSKRTSTTKKLDSNIIAEYYDLPYRYNETIVKILYQTPHILFVYWDISDADRNAFMQKYGEDFFL